MKKIVSFVSLTLAAVGLASGCAYDVQEEADVGMGEEAACNNLDGTNAMLASLAAVIGHELGRWQITQDFQVTTGHNNQQILKLKDATRSKCLNGSNCRNIDWMLAWQDSRADQQFVFKGGQKLNSWTYASRLVAGYNNQVTCDNRGFTDVNGCRIGEKINNQWVGVSHFLKRTAREPFTSCNGLDEGLELWTFSAVRGKTDGSIGDPGVTLPLPANGANELRKKLIWAYNGASSPNVPENQINPYLVFSSPDNMTVKIDPGGDNGEQPPPPAQSCVDACQMPPFNPAPPAGSPDVCCTCATTNAAGQPTIITGTLRPWIDAPRRIPAGTLKCYQQ